MDRRANRITRNFVRSCLPAAALLGLAACNTTGLTASLSPPTAQELALACPKVTIIRDLDTVTEFRPGGGRDASDVVVRGQLVDFVGNCEYGDDGVTVNLNLILGAEKGPALTGNQAKFRYFVGVLRPGQEQLANKAEFDTDVTFPEGQSRAANKEELTPRIPLPKDANAKDWRIAVGFQLTPEQRDYNLANSAKAKARK